MNKINNKFTWIIYTSSIFPKQDDHHAKQEVTYY